MIQGLDALRAYGASPLQEEAVVARQTQDIETQLRIAEYSNHRLVLLNLALNNNIDDEVVQSLYKRDIKYLTNRLNALGYKKTTFLGF